MIPCHVCKQLEKQYLLELKGRCVMCDVQQAGTLRDYTDNAVRKRWEAEGRRKKMKVGKHVGKHFMELWEEEKGYCRWATNLDEASGELKRLVEWLQRA